MKNDKRLFVVSYYDNKNIKHMTFVNKFNSFVRLKDQYGEKVSLKPLIIK